MKRKLVWKMLLLGTSLLTINAWGNKTISFTADLNGNLDIHNGYRSQESRQSDQPSGS